MNWPETLDQMDWLPLLTTLLSATHTALKRKHETDSAKNVMANAIEVAVFGGNKVTSQTFIA